MNEPTNSAIAGAAAGVAVTLTQQLDRVEDRSRSARSHARDAERLAQQNQAKLSQLGLSDIERISADRFADLANGTAYPAQSAVTTPATFPTPPVPPARPVVDDGVAGSFAAYPGATNEYDAEGRMVDPASPFLGQNFATGLAISSVEVRAALLGMMRQSTSNPSSEQAKQLYRFFQGVTRHLEGSAYSQDEFTAAIQRLMTQQSATYRKLAQFFSLSGVLMVGLTTETAVFELTVPAGSLVNPGDELEVNGDGQQVTNNAADTTRVRVRLGSVGGVILADSTAQALAALQPHTERLIATLVGPTQLRIGGPFGGFPFASNATVVFDPTIDQKLVWTVQHSTNSVANVSRFDAAAIWLKR